MSTTNRTTEVFVNFYQNPGSDVITASSHESRAKADAAFPEPHGKFRSVSKKERIACIKVPCVCVVGQFDV